MKKKKVFLRCFGWMCRFPSCQTSSINVWSELWRLFVLHHQQSCRNLWYTTPRLPAGFFLNGERSTMRSCLSESVRKMGRWVLERGGRVGDHGGGEGYLWICLRHLHPLFDTTGRRVSVRMCERGRHPQGWTLNPDFWRRDQTFKLHIWRVEGSRKKESGFQREREREGETGRRVVKRKKMDAMRHTLPRLQLTVPMPIKMGKVGLTFEVSWYSERERLSIWKRLAGSCEEFSPLVVLVLFIYCWMGGVH